MKAANISVDIFYLFSFGKRHGQHGLSVADELVFPSYALPEISADVPEWYGAMLRFFAEKGLRIHDEGEKQ